MKKLQKREQALKALIKLGRNKLGIWAYGGFNHHSSSKRYRRWHYWKRIYMKTL